MGPQTGKKFEKLELANEFTLITYQQHGQRMQNFVKGLQKFLNRKLASQEKVVVYAETQMDWMITGLGCFSQNAALVTVYATLGEEGVAHACNQTKAKIAVVDHKLAGIVGSIISRREWSHH